MMSPEDGSSPLARGLRRPGPAFVHPRGIIPARAGFTGRLWSCQGRPRDHPRSRGVYLCTPGCGALKLGSSPLARGLRRDQGGHVRLPGIIPARAGFTTPPHPWRTSPRDHPRSRGVYMARNSAGSLGSGSSPLARGLPTSSATGPWPGTDHPRSRGVYPESSARTPAISGSSPLARGLLWDDFSLLSILRIIPARAGFT